MYLEDYGNPDDSISDAVERQFNEHYLGPLGDGAKFVRLESTLRVEYGGRLLIHLWQNCTNRKLAAIRFLKRRLKHWMMTWLSWCFWLCRGGIWKFASDLQSRGEFVIRSIINKLIRQWSINFIELDKKKTRDVVRACLWAFPQIWASIFCACGTSLMLNAAYLQLVSTYYCSPCFSPTDLTVVLVTREWAVAVSGLEGLLIHPLDSTGGCELWFLASFQACWPRHLGSAAGELIPFWVSFQVCWSSTSLVLQMVSHWYP